MVELKNFIGRQWQEGQGPAFSSTAPASGDVIADGHFASPTQIDEAVTAARTAFRDWSRMPLTDRYAVVEQYAKIANERKEELAAVISQESGKALWDARTEASAVTAKVVVSLSAYHDRTPTRSDGVAHLTHRPHGPVAVLGPFNFPAHLPNGHIVPALIAGNTVVFKPSEMTPAVAHLMVQFWKEAGLPPGVVNLVHGGASEAQHLIAHDDIAGVFFTGGVAAGRAIHEALAGQPQKILALELGGNNPLVAWDVADAAAAARIVVKSAFITGGQRCTCARRLIVEDNAGGAAIVDALAAIIPSITVGPPDRDPPVFMGPLISENAATAVLNAQDALLRDGAQWIVRAKTGEQGGAFVTPGLLDVTEVKMRKDEEVFGPLLQVIRTRKFDDAIAEANATRFGLSAGLMSDNAALWDRFRQEIRAGIVNWNRQTTGASGKMPFGGPGLSGNHRPAGYYAADYCSWPMAGMTQPGAVSDTDDIPGLHQ